MTRGDNPGDWRTSRTTESGRQVEVAVDLMVADSVAGAGSRGARLGKHGKSAARRSVGLEGALIDSRVMEVRSLSGDGRVVEANVAGPTALLVAKVHKVCDRLETASGRRLEVGKDALDIVRILSMRSPEENARVFGEMLSDERSEKVALSALGFLREYSSSEGAEIPRLAQAALGHGTPRVDRACSTYVNRLLRAVSDAGIDY